MTLSCEDAVEALLGQLLERLRQVAHAGVVDEDVEAAEALLRRLDHRLDVGGAGDVGAHAEGGVAEHGVDPCRALAVAVGDDHLRAFGDELARDAFAESGRRAGDDRDPACEPHVVSPRS